MAILIWFAVLLPSWLIVAWLLRYVERTQAVAASKQHSGKPIAVSTSLQPAGTPGSPPPGSEPPPDTISTSLGTRDQATWTALDDLQLTRFLKESARRNNTE